MMASYNGHVDVVNVLLQHGASVDLQNKVKIQLFYVLVISPLGVMFMHPRVSCV